MTKLWSTLKKGFLVSLFLVPLGVFVVKNLRDAYFWLSQLSDSFWLNVFLGLVIIFSFLFICGLIYERIKLFFDVFFRKIGKEALLKNVDAWEALIVVGQTNHWGQPMWIGYPASFFSLACLPAKFIPVDSPQLIFTHPPRSAAQTLFSGSTYWLADDQDEKNQKN